MHNLGLAIMLLKFVSIEMWPQPTIPKIGFQQCHSDLHIVIDN